MHFFKLFTLLFIFNLNFIYGNTVLEPCSLHFTRLHTLTYEAAKRVKRKIYSRINTETLSSFEIYYLMLPIIEDLFRHRMHIIHSNAIDVEDLLQEAFFWVDDACREYNPSRGASLSNFLITKLKTKFYTYARDHNPGRSGDFERRKLLYRIASIYKALYGKSIPRRDQLVILARYLKKRRAKSGVRHKKTLEYEIRTYLRAEKHDKLLSYDPGKAHTHNSAHAAHDTSDLFLNLFGRTAFILRAINLEITRTLEEDPSKARKVKLRRLLALKFFILGLPFNASAPLVQLSQANLKNSIRSFYNLLSDSIRSEITLDEIRELRRLLKRFATQNLKTVLRAFSKAELAVLHNLDPALKTSTHGFPHNFSAQELFIMLDKETNDV